MGLSLDGKDVSKQAEDTVVICFQAMTGEYTAN
jgi:hypothetical protein